MGTISEKLTYLNETKQLLKDKINNLGGSIDEHTTFRQYANQLQNVYDNLPKTEYQEGTEVNLGVTSKGKLDFDNGVVGIGQSSQESTTGKQLFNKNASFDKSNIATNQWTITTLETGIKVKCARTTAGTPYILYILKDLTNDVGKTIRVKASWSVSGSRIPSMSLVLCESDGNNETNKATLNTSGSTASFVVPELSGNQKYLAVRFFSTISTGSTADDYIDFTDVIVTINNEDMSYEKYTGGIPAPNPSYPQDIKVVRGKNRLDDSNLVLFNSNKYISTTNYTTQGKIAVNPSTTYSLVYKKSSINDFNMWEFDSSNNKTAISSTGSDNGNYRVRLFTTLSTTKTISFYAGSNDTYTSVEEFLQAKALMLLEGDYSSQAIPSYLPYNTIEEVVSGKNLVEGLELGEINAQTGVESQTNNIVRLKNYIPYSKLKSYRQSVNGENLSSSTGLRFYNKDKVYIGYANFSTTASIQDVSITIGSGVTTTDLEPKYFRIRVGTSVLQTDSKYMIATSNDLTYEPYITPASYQLSLGDKKLYEDSFISKESDGWYFNDYFREIEADEHLAWSMDSNESWAGNRFTCQNLPSLGVTTQTTFTNAYCNYAKNGNTSDYTSHLNVFLLRYINNKNRIDCMFNLASVNELKTILANNPMKIVFKGTELIKTPITDTTLINQLENWYNAKSNNGTTIITSNGNLPMIIKVRGLKGE